jgi:hypothetical protein
LDDVSPCYGHNKKEQIGIVTRIKGENVLVFTHVITLSLSFKDKGVVEISYRFQTFQVVSQKAQHQVEEKLRLETHKIPLQSYPQYQLQFEFEGERRKTIPRNSISSLKRFSHIFPLTSTRKLFEGNVHLKCGKLLFCIK